MFSIFVLSEKSAAESVASAGIEFVFVLIEFWFAPKAPNSDNTSVHIDTINLFISVPPFVVSICCSSRVTYRGRGYKAQMLPLQVRFSILSNDLRENHEFILIYLKNKFMRYVKVPHSSRARIPTVIQSDLFSK